MPVVAEHGLGGRPEGQALLQLLAAAVGDPGHLRGKALYQLPFLFQQALRDQHGHSHIHMAGFLKHSVHDALNILPNGIAVGPKDHKTLDGGVIHQLRFQANIGVPLGEVHLHGGDGFHISLVFSHDVSPNFFYKIIFKKMYSN